MRIAFSVAVTALLLLVVSTWGYAADSSTKTDSSTKADAAKHESILLWPNGAPGEKPDAANEEKDTSPGSGIIRLGNVSRPMITLFRPAAEKDTGAAVIVCPGGGYNILAYDLEGTEVCDWLNSIGVTGVLLKYRVPAKGAGVRTGPLQDAQRAIGLVRSKAEEWKIDPKRIGILGFSAGGHLSALASNNFDSRAYPPGDDADKTSCRPDFTILIYPAYLTAKDDTTALAPEIKVTKQTPPAFVTMTADDPVHVENAYAYGLALKRSGVPAEVHIYPKGGHGYGLRPSENAVSHWPDRAADWLKGQGIVKK